MPPISRLRSAGGVVSALVAACTIASCSGERHELVLAGGRVVDPESGLDAIRWVAIDGGRVVEISERSLGGRRVLNVTGLVVAPGFIDMHATPDDSAGMAALALSGVTTALLLEPGAYPVDAWLARRTGRSPIHFGAAVAYARARADSFPLRTGAGAVLADQPLDGTGMEALVRRVREGLAAGALGLGFARGDAPGATVPEIEDLFAVAAFDRMPVFARPRDGSAESLEELFAAAAWQGTSLHLVDIGAWHAGSLDGVLRPDVSGELRLGEGGSPDAALAQAGVILSDDRGGAFLRALGPYLDDEPGLGDALARFTSLPARRLQDGAPDFARKGRIQSGTDADLVLFDPATLEVRHLIVDGTLVVRDGVLVPGAAPGRALKSIGGM